MPIMPLHVLRKNAALARLALRSDREKLAETQRRLESIRLPDVLMELSRDMKILHAEMAHVSKLTAESAEKLHARERDLDRMRNEGRQIAGIIDALVREMP